MSVFKRGDVWWYKFRFANRLIRESAKTPSKTVARDAEKKRHRELEEAYNNLTDNREHRIQTINAIARSATSIAGPRTPGNGSIFGGLESVPIYFQIPVVPPEIRLRLDRSASW